MTELATRINRQFHLDQKIRIGVAAIGIVMTVFMSQNAGAAAECPWIATSKRSTEDIVKDIDAKLGKKNSIRKPLISCGGGSDYKVCTSCVDRPTDEQWSKIRYMLAEPAYRDWHAHWHSKAFTENQKFAAASGGRMSNTEVSGENFFYFHREMIRALQANLAANGLPCIAPWNELPKTADDKTWPTIETLRKAEAAKACAKFPEEERKKVENFNRALSEGTKEIQTDLAKKFSELDKRNDPSAFTEQDKLFRERNNRTAELRSRVMSETGVTDELITKFGECGGTTFNPFASSQESLVATTSTQSQSDFLKKNSLGNVGNSIDNSWHGQLHSVYDTIQPKKCSMSSLDPECDGMGTPQSSHVNIHFYKVHGMVDHDIDLWLKANGYEIASTNCSGKAHCYQWSSTYPGDVPDFIQGSGCSLKHSRGTTEWQPSGSNNQNSAGGVLNPPNGTSK